jgi:hypothetical protein
MKTVSNQGSFLFVTADLFTAMDMTQTRANENRIFTAHACFGRLKRLEGKRKIQIADLFDCRAQTLL